MSRIAGADIGMFRERFDIKANDEKISLIHKETGAAYTFYWNGVVSAEMEADATGRGSITFKFDTRYLYSSMSEIATHDPR